MSAHGKIYLKVFSILSAILGLVFFACFGIAELYGEESPMLWLAIIFSCMGLASLRRLKKQDIVFKPIDGYIITCASWLYVCLMGALPYMLAGKGYGIFPSIFQSVANFTTTGLSAFVMDEIPHYLLMFRAISNWLGGLGVLVVIVALLPALGISSVLLTDSSVGVKPFVQVGKKKTGTGRFLFQAYVVLTAAEYLLLLISPFDWFNALLNTFSSISTAGLILTTETAPIASNLFVRLVVLVFTIAASVNFIIYLLSKADIKKGFAKNAETFYYFAIIIAAIVLVTLSLRFSGRYGSIWQAFKDGICQVVSFASTSGFYVCDYTTWPTFAVVVLFTLMIIGGCSLSTSGSLKVIRVVVLSKVIRRGFFKQVHRNAVSPIVVDGHVVPTDKLVAVTDHILLYFATLIGGCVLMGLNNFDMTTTISTTLACFSNTGVALGIDGIFNNFSFIVLAFMMLAGRLELYALFMTCLKEFWKRG